MAYRVFQSSKVIRTDPNRPRTAPQADKPKVRLEGPGTITGSVGFYAQLCDCSKRVVGQPEVVYVQVVIQESQNPSGLYFTFIPAIARGDDVYELKFDTDSRSPLLRGLKPLLVAARITLLDETVYEMETEIVQDNSGGYMVVAPWTTAKAFPRHGKTRNAAAGVQEPEK